MQVDKGKGTFHDLTDIHPELEPQQNEKPGVKPVAFGTCSVADIDFLRQICGMARSKKRKRDRQRQRESRYVRV
ncbi:MAG TPA: hypothetical protein ENF77_04535, partial [Candidatus Acetothermia bacterium]|nr:hypothetical protein [Candidatus Acetothermia bacterium]